MEEEERQPGGTEEKEKEAKGACHVVSRGRGDGAGRWGWLGGRMSVTSARIGCA